MIFEAVKIDNKLEVATEKAAIDALKIDDKNTVDVFKSALSTEQITLNDGTKDTFSNIAKVFTTYNVTWNETDKKLICDEKDKDGNTTPARLTTLITDTDENDLAYLIYKISSVLGVETTGLLEKNLNKQTIAQLTSLKTKIEAENLNEEVENVGKLESKDIAFTLYSGVTADQVVAAVETLKTANLTLANTIIPLLKSGDVQGVQEALNMTANDMFLYKQADGKFGARTLANLKAGKVVEYT